MLDPNKRPITPPYAGPVPTVCPYVHTSPTLIVLQPALTYVQNTPGICSPRLTPYSVPITLTATGGGCVWEGARIDPPYHVSAVVALVNFPGTTNKTWGLQINFPSGSQPWHGLKMSGATPGGVYTADIFCPFPATITVHEFP